MPRGYLITYISQSIFCCCNKTPESKQRTKNRSIFGSWCWSWEVQKHGAGTWWKSSYCLWACWDRAGLPAPDLLLFLQRPLFEPPLMTSSNSDYLQKAPQIPLLMALEIKGQHINFSGTHSHRSRDFSNHPHLDISATFWWWAGRTNTRTTWYYSFSYTFMVKLIFWSILPTSFNSMIDFVILN
jgi:hypothetical protein